VTLVKKARTFRKQTLSGTATNKYQGSITSQASYERKICEHQMTWSEGHPWPRRRGISNIGGNFETIRTRYQASFDLSRVFSIRQVGNPSAFERDYVGHFMPDPSGMSAFLQSSTETDLRTFVPSLGDTTIGSMGARAISSTAPTAPAVDLGVALAEIWREGLPSLVGLQLYKARGNKAESVKTAGGEYLNLAFGYLPLLSAIRDTAKAVMAAEELTRQLLRDSGKNVRRSYTFPVDRSITEVKLGTSSFPWPGLTSYHWTNSMQPIKHTTVERRVWFDGCFTYYVDPQAFQGLVGHAERARLLYGLTLNPSVVWNLLPWSWLIDWFAGVGPVMDNLSLFSRDGLTLRYGYTMEHIKVTQTQSYPGLVSPGGYVPPNPSITLTGDRKIRREQSPFVLGLTGQNLQVRQLAILAALGISRS
jgi:hypothetical protein